MIVLDIESSGVHPEKNGIFQIAALDFNNPENVFLEECRIDNEDEIYEEALKITWKTEEELRDVSKQSQKEMLEKFFSWLSQIKMKNIIAQQPHFDLGFISFKARKYGLISRISYRSFDIHTIAQEKYYKLHKEFIKDMKGNSGMDLRHVMEFCGLEDKRITLYDNKITHEGKPHDAMEDAKIHAECFSRLVLGKNFASDFKDFPVPDYLLS